mmetsp:Transcript_7372/g.17206  ORF Transcript_7372/g.17206 Transcript_7372/m.17206 type:complete len:373 (-) Transcript_7372:211-1329(-)
MGADCTRAGARAARRQRLRHHLTRRPADRRRLQGSCNCGCSRQDPPLPGRCRRARQGAAGLRRRRRRQARPLNVHGRRGRRPAASAGERVAVSRGSIDRRFDAARAPLPLRLEACPQLPGERCALLALLLCRWYAGRQRFAGLDLPRAAPPPLARRRAQAALEATRARAARAVRAWLGAAALLRDHLLARADRRFDARYGARAHSGALRARHAQRRLAVAGCALRWRRVARRGGVRAPLVARASEDVHPVAQHPADAPPALVPLRRGRLRGRRVCGGPCGRRCARQLARRAALQHRPRAGQPEGARARQRLRAAGRALLPNHRLVQGAAAAAGLPRLPLLRSARQPARPFLEDVYWGARRLLRADARAVPRT